MDLFDLVEKLIGDFSGGTMLGLGTLFFLFIEFLRGKVVVGDKVLGIPWLTKKFEALSKNAKIFIIMGSFGALGVITHFSGGDETTVKALLDAFVSGASFGGVTIGVRATVKAAKEETIDKFRSSMKKDDADAPKE